MPFTVVDAKSIPPGITRLWFASTILNFEALKVNPECIAWNSKRIKGRFEPTDALLSDDPVAIVAYGPSLQDTWPLLKDFKAVITCSGSHKFLLNRGITPTYHVESDPRIHKADMLGAPSQETTYLVASICHPRYFDTLEGYKVKLWHILFEEPAVYSLVPKGDWILTGGNTVGPRAIKIARLLGFVNLHLFGFDGSGKHAGEHGNPVPDHKFRKVNVAGQSYLTTENLFTHMELLFKDLCFIPDARFTFHGEGLIQAIAKQKKFEFVDGWPLAVAKDD